MERTKIKELLEAGKQGADITAMGWVRTKRDSKNVNFIALNDGSTIKNLQVVADVEKIGADTLERIATGACIAATGELVESQGSGQSYGCPIYSK